MCKKRIEDAVKSMDGDTSADWIQETKMITVKYKSEEVEILDVHKAIARVLSYLPKNEYCYLTITRRDDNIFAVDLKTTKQRKSKGKDKSQQIGLGCYCSGTGWTPQKEREF